MKRAVSVAKLLERKLEVYEFDGIWGQVIGNPERNGIWLIYGREKNGKTWFALKLAEYLSALSKVLYISAEEGTGPNFQSSCIRANLDYKNRDLQFTEYIPIAELEMVLKRRYSPRVVIIDNTSVYGSELKSADIVRLMRNERVLFIILAHEKRNQPDGATAVMAKKLAKVILRVEGLTADVSGRVPGGQITIDENRSLIYWGAPVGAEE
jgi:predicted ATP-dependent serine protease